MVQTEVEELLDGPGVHHSIPGKEERQRESPCTAGQHRDWTHTAWVSI